MRMSLRPANKHMSVSDNEFGMPTRKSHGDTSAKLPGFT